MNPHHAFLVAAVAVSGLGAWIDWKTGHIPNWVSLTPLLAAPILHAAAAGFKDHGGLAGGARSAEIALIGAFVCSAVPLLLYRFGAMGGGDVKLFAAIGALCGVSVGIEAQFLAFVAAAVVVPVRFAWEGKLFRVLTNTALLMVNPFLPARRRRTISPEMLTAIRFGPAIFAGVVGSALDYWGAP